MSHFARISVVGLYDDINNQRNYASAFYLYGYKSTDSYCQFVQGYANTEHADISTFESSILLADGSVDVTITVGALNETGSGTETNFYIFM